MKKILAILLVICTLLALCGCSKDSGEEQDESVSGASVTLEGKGFKSPEKAAQAYAEALQSGDVREILSTFAIETYVENMSVEDYIAYTGAYSLTSGPAGDDSYCQEIRMVQRQNQICTILTSLYMYHSSYGVVSAPIPYRNDPYGTPAELMEDLVVEDWMKLLKKMEIGDVLSAEDLMPDKISDGYISNLETRAEYYGCDEIVPLAVEITLDGVDYYLCVDAACYDGKWYNLSPNGTIGAMMGAGQDTGYLVER